MLLSGSNKKRKTSTSSKKDEEQELMWECTLCTFRNKSEAYKCEMCDTRKGTSTRKPRLNESVVERQKTMEKLAAQQHEKPERVTRRKPEEPTVSRSSSLRNDSPKPKQSNQRKSSPQPGTSGLEPKQFRTDPATSRGVTTAKTSSSKKSVTGRSAESPTVSLAPSVSSVSAVTSLSSISSLPSISSVSSVSSVPSIPSNPIVARVPAEPLFGTSGSSSSKAPKTPKVHNIGRGKRSTPKELENPSLPTFGVGKSRVINTSHLPSRYIDNLGLIPRDKVRIVEPKEKKKPKEPEVKRPIPIPIPQKEIELCDFLPTVMREVLFNDGNKKTSNKKKTRPNEACAEVVDGVWKPNTSHKKPSDETKFVNGFLGMVFDDLNRSKEKRGKKWTKEERTDNRAIRKLIGEDHGVDRLAVSEMFNAMPLCCDVVALKYLLEKDEANDGSKDENGKAFTKKKTIMKKQLLQMLLGSETNSSKVKELKESSSKMKPSSGLTTSGARNKKKLTNKKLEHSSSRKTEKSSSKRVKGSSEDAINRKRTHQNPADELTKQPKKRSRECSDHQHKKRTSKRSTDFKSISSDRKREQQSEGRIKKHSSQKIRRQDELESKEHSEKKLKLKSELRIKKRSKKQLGQESQKDRKRSSGKRLKQGSGERSEDVQGDAKQDVEKKPGAENDLRKVLFLKKQSSKKRSKSQTKIKLRRSSKTAAELSDDAVKKKSEKRRKTTDHQMEPCSQSQSSEPNPTSDVHSNAQQEREDTTELQKRKGRQSLGRGKTVTRRTSSRSERSKRRKVDDSVCIEPSKISEVSQIP